MKRILQLFLTVFVFILSSAQAGLKPIAKEVKDFQNKKIVFKKVNPFTSDNTSGKQMVYQLAARDAKVLNLDKKQLRNLISEKPEALEMDFPFENRQLTVEMVRVDIYSPEFKAETNKRQITNYKKGVFYRGIIKGDNTSVVAFSFFDNDVVGIASANNIGNVTLGKAVNSEDFVVYNDQKLTGKNPFICSADELMENETQKVRFDPQASKAPQMTDACVRVYYEICYKPFQQNGSDVTNTINWISAVHNNINTLYVNDGVKMSLKTVYVWETADPYTGSYSANLSAFRSNRTTFEGDLAHLVNYPSTTSVAYLNSLCTNNRYAYSGINMTFNDIPTYSWTVMAMTHEMGHALGSPHTHACSWNGDGTAIDGCAPTYNPDLAEGDCPIGPIPSDGGTIMSYCHLVSTGINFTKGFGEQPGALIRQTVDSKACLSGNCVTACSTTVTGLSVPTVAKTTATVAITDATSTEWKYRVSLMDGTVVQSGNTIEKNFNIQGLSQGTFYKIEVGTDCSPAYQRSQIILTDDDWCGKTITDTGGADGNYSDSETWSKTFYPDNDTQKLKITFQEFNLEQGYDFLTVRNGPSTTSPIFSGSNNMSGTTIRGPFESTHETGAITLVFRSDAMVNEAGFKAILECSVLGLNEASTQKLVSISPNPVKNQFKIDGIQKIENVKVFDQSGKLVKEFNSDSVSRNNFDVSRLKTGTYIVTIKSQKGTLNKKLIKQ